MSGIGGQSNTMSSINRPTSRVLAPPGGGSSNIFGAMSDPTPAPSNSSRTGRSNEQSCNIFGQPVVEHKQPVKQAAAPTPGRVVYFLYLERDLSKLEALGPKVVLSQILKGHPI